jgi:hypothetical protein
MDRRSQPTTPRKVTTWSLITTVLAAIALVPCSATADPGAVQSGSVQYLSFQPSAVGSAPSGWGLSANVQERSVNLRDHGSQWTDDTDARPYPAAAGYGWRDGGSSIVLGYQQRGPAPSAAGPRSYGFPSRARSGVFGLSITVRRR